MCARRVAPPVRKGGSLADRTRGRHHLPSPRPAPAGRIGQGYDQQVTPTQISPPTRMTFYIGIETLAQIENYSFSAEPNLGTASLSAPFDEIFLLAVRHRDDASPNCPPVSRRKI